jgi:SAM-dependent methyltransferase
VSSGAALAEVEGQYREDLVQWARADHDRQVFQVDLVAQLAPGGTVVDLGGGFTTFTIGCAAAGMTAIIVDDFADPAYVDKVESASRVHREHGVQLVTRDLIADGLGMEPRSIDIIASFDSLEHWHNSPKALLAEVVRALRPGGWFFLGVPNALNLRKRIAVPFGRAKWSQMADWYEQPVFRGHVREPDVDDLRYIARDMALVNVQVLGRNWQGLKHPNRRVRRITALIDRPLRSRPSLCSDIYLLGQKPID